MGLPLMMLMFLPLILVMLWQSRSQQKKQDQLVSSLKKGDRVVTQSGLVGRLAEVDNRYAKVEIAPGVKVTMLRTSLTGRDTEDSAKKDDASKKDESKKSDDAEAKK
jgi:preprotein translocase subunit YajC